MVNPKTIDSVMVKAISKEMIEQTIVIDTESKNAQPIRAHASTSISYQKRKKETVMDAINHRVGLLFFSLMKLLNHNNKLAA